MKRRTTIEICTAIVAACAPCLKPLVRSALNTTSHDRSKTGYINHEDGGYSRRAFSNALDARASSKKNGIHLGSVSQVYRGSGNGRSESQEMFGRLPEHERSIEKTVSVSVR